MTQQLARAHLERAWPVIGPPLGTAPILRRHDSCGLRASQSLRVLPLHLLAL